ncbi:Importin subunit alpha-3 [Halocaridina rubra]|uniref:Importin subunit alpha-3 n=1 Tax=Halocaridina rubra TaxID=373956 RepID=A0AAN8WYY8_HALRR
MAEQDGSHMRQPEMETEDQEKTEEERRKEMKEIAREAAAKEEDIGELAIEIVNGMRSHDPKVQISNAEKARQLLSNPQPPIQQFIDAGILPVLAACMNRNDLPHLQLEATWAVTNIASGPTEYTYALVEANHLPVLVDLLSNGRSKVQEQAVWALGNIVGDGPDCRDQALEEGIIRPLIELLASPIQVPLRRQVCWVLTNLFRVKNPVMSDDDKKLVANALKELVRHFDPQVQADALWAVAYFADLGSDYIDDLIGCGITRELVQRLYSNDSKVIAAALRATGTHSCGKRQPGTIQRESCFLISCQTHYTIV